MSEEQQPRHGTGPRPFFPLTLVFWPSAMSTHSSKRYSRTLSTVGSASIPFLLHQTCHAVSLPSTSRRVSALACCPMARACHASNAAAVGGLHGGGCALALGAAIWTPSASPPPLSTSMPPWTGSSRSSHYAGGSLRLQISTGGLLFACTVSAGLVGSCWSASRRGRHLVSLTMHCTGSTVGAPTWVGWQHPSNRGTRKADRATRECGDWPGRGGGRGSDMEFPDSIGLHRNPCRSN